MGCMSSRRGVRTDGEGLVAAGGARERDAHVDRRRQRTHDEHAVAKRCGEEAGGDESVAREERGKRDVQQVEGLDQAVQAYRGRGACELARRQVETREKEDAACGTPRHGELWTQRSATTTKRRVYAREAYRGGDAHEKVPPIEETHYRFGGRL